MMSHSKTWGKGVGGAMEIVEIKKKWALCARYEPTPIYQLTDGDALRLASKMSESAMRSMRLTEMERRMFCQSVFDSILYFNSRSQEHLDHMRYLAEREAAEDGREETGDTLTIVQ